MLITTTKEDTPYPVRNRSCAALRLVLTPYPACCIFLSLSIILVHVMASFLSLRNSIGAASLFIVGEHASATPSWITPAIFPLLLIIILSIIIISPCHPHSTILIKESQRHRPLPNILHNHIATPSSCHPSPNQSPNLAHHITIPRLQRLTRRLRHNQHHLQVKDRSSSRENSGIAACQMSPSTFSYQDILTS